MGTSFVGDKVTQHLNSVIYIINHYDGTNITLADKTLPDWCIHLSIWLKLEKWFPKNHIYISWRLFQIFTDYYQSLVVPNRISKVWKLEQSWNPVLYLILYGQNTYFHLFGMKWNKCAFILITEMFTVNIYQLSNWKRHSQTKNDITFLVLYLMASRAFNQPNMSLAI